jgi:hypothetical protein
MCKFLGRARRYRFVYSLLARVLVLRGTCKLQLVSLSFSVGSILCEPSSPVQAVTRLRARVMVFDIEVPLTRGFPVGSFSHLRIVFFWGGAWH